MVARWGAGGCWENMRVLDSVIADPRGQPPWRRGVSGAARKPLRVVYTISSHFQRLQSLILLRTNVRRRLHGTFRDYEIRSFSLPSGAQGETLNLSLNATSRLVSHASYRTVARTYPSHSLTSRHFRMRLTILQNNTTQLLILIKIIKISARIDFWITKS